MKEKTFLDAFTRIDSRYLLEADPDSESAGGRPAKRKEKNMTKWIIAAAAVLMIGAAFLFASSPVRQGANDEGDSAFTLSDASYGVTVEVVEHPEEPMLPMVKLLDLTEEELFSRWPTAIVRGTVTNITNVSLTAGDISVVKAIVTVSPSKVLRGDVAGDLKILVSCPIDGTFQMEDTETVSAIRTGMEGIFMVLPYGDDECWELENASLRWKDIADYNFPDGRRYAFLSTDSGLLYAEWAYPGLAGAANLDQVEAYITSMIQ